MTTQTNENKFFNFTANATCYVNDIRTVKSQGKDYVSFKVAILEGAAEKTNKIFADLIVSGKQAQEIVEAYRNYWPSFNTHNGHKWFASIRIGSLYAKTYEHKGKIAATLGGRLLKITYLKIGETVIDLSVFEQEPTESQPVQQVAPQATQPAPQPVQQVAPQATQPARQPVQQVAPQATQPAPQPVQQVAPQATQPAPQPVQQVAPQATQPVPQPVQQVAPQATQPVPQPVQQVAPQAMQPA